MSRTDALIAGPIAAPAIPFDGSTSKVTFDDAAGVTSNGLLPAVGKPAAVATREKDGRALVIVRSVNVATPSIALTVTVPPSSATPLGERLIVTELVIAVTVFPTESTKATEIVPTLPAVVVEGWA